jgi:hypothetical protein
MKKIIVDADFKKVLMIYQHFKGVNSVDIFCSL